jgi:purine-binding chemotaxis protein CheW
MTVTETSQYMTFRLGDELFAIDVAQVREVLEVSAITRVPGAPEYMRGLINVRGKAIPVIDLRLRFGLPAAVRTLNTRVIVMDLMLDGELTVLGGIADSVHEVIELEPSSIAVAPRIAMRWKAELIRGLGRRGDDFIIIPDINAVFAGEGSALVAHAECEQPEEVAA